MIWLGAVSGSCLSTPSFAGRRYAGEIDAQHPDAEAFMARLDDLDDGTFDPQIANAMEPVTDAALIPLDGTAVPQRLRCTRLFLRARGSWRTRGTKSGLYTLELCAPLRRHEVNHEPH